jgi:diadenosine tetraphosphate (Ap4A) HIT family hydrolase
MSKTLKKFGYPNNLLREYENWYILFRYEQVTLGSLILITKNNEYNLSEVSKEGFEEYPIIINHIETVLKEVFGYEKINYIMLMMIDPEVHYHVIPRYSKDILFEKNLFEDKGWPGFPAFSEPNSIDKKLQKQIIAYLRGKFDSV